MRIAIDTNVLIAALAKPRGSGARVLRAWREGELEIVCSEATLWEAKAVLDSEWLARITPGGEIERLLSELRAKGVRVRPSPILDLGLKDEGDLRLVEAAAAGGASYVVTSDRELLLKRGYASVEFVTPSELLGMLKRRRES